MEKAAKETHRRKQKLKDCFQRLTRKGGVWTLAMSAASVVDAASLESTTGSNHPLLASRSPRSVAAAGGSNGVSTLASFGSHYLLDEDSDGEEGALCSFSQHLLAQILHFFTYCVRLVVFLLVY